MESMQARIRNIALIAPAAMDALMALKASAETAGLPDNPSAWLMRVARNRAFGLLRRDAQFRDFTPELVHLRRLREELPGPGTAFEQEIRDDQLRMMFSCCHPELSPEAQVTLILKTLCGFRVS
ncbi:MAG: sigma-70 region 2 domain protein [Acidobacteria bacterium]|nr:sigma-70 region 2 domain protein [Acidobacteriota bacterium]